MACLVVSRDALLLLRNDAALLLRADAHLDKGFLHILIADKFPVVAGRIDGSLVHEIFQIRAGEASRCLGDLCQIHIVSQRFSLGMHLQDLFSSLDIWSAHANLPVKTAGTQNRGIQDIHPVGGSHHNDALIDAETVHLHQQLVQCLLPLVMSAAHTGAAASRHRVDLIDKNNTGGVFLRILKQIPDTGSTHADEHFHEIGTGNGEKRHARFACHCLGQQGFTGSRRAHQQHALGDSCAHLNIFLRCFQEIHDLL